MRALLYRFIVAAWALLMRITRGRLPFGVQFVPASPVQPSQPQAPQDAQPSSGGATQGVKQP
jgi:hypothetical protein